MFGVEEDEDGWVNIGTQDEAVRWSEIRKYAGWAALQHERVYTRLLDIDSGGLYSLSLSGAISYSILLQNQRSWYSGDLYAPQSPTPHYLRLVPGSYEIVVLYAYDVRVSGDPPSGIPQGQWKLEVKKKAEGGCNVVGTIVPDMVNGWLMGTIAGVEIQNLGENTLQIEGVVAELAEVSPFSHHCNEANKLSQRTILSPVFLLAPSFFSFDFCGSTTNSFASSHTLSAFSLLFKYH